MAGLSQSAFLQALGWATLNSFWQMALLWCVFLGANYFFRLSAQNKYYLSAVSVISGAVWFFVSFFFHYCLMPVKLTELMIRQIASQSFLIKGVFAFFPCLQQADKRVFWRIHHALRYLFHALSALI